jgi:hypothetical protein
LLKALPRKGQQPLVPTAAATLLHCIDIALSTAIMIVHLPSFKALLLLILIKQYGFRVIMKKSMVSRALRPIAKLLLVNTMPFGKGAHQNPSLLCVS